MQIAYAAHTDACTFYLDEEGICRRVVRKRSKIASDEKAERCLGAQYVASLDAEGGGLVALPRVGMPMLFAYVGENGRIALVRTGAVVRFEESGAIGDRPSQRETTPSLPDGDAPAAKPGSGVRARPDEDDDDDDDPRTWVDGRRFGEAQLPPTEEIPAVTERAPEPANEIDETDDGARTQLFRSSRPPIPVARVPIVPATPSVRALLAAPVPGDFDSPPSTERDPSPPSSRTRGMLPARTTRASRGRS
jgi:hypothetical protein